MAAIETQTAVIFIDSDDAQARCFRLSALGTREPSPLTQTDVDTASLNSSGNAVLAMLEETKAQQERYDTILRCFWSFFGGVWLALVHIAAFLYLVS